ncbi:50S ribosomal protein L11 methyltransferase [Numidum massiliense]|uniref:50S ribosomal protein L11 methyltransferase n=1 Tax=Numidum massiliense TaxID=1522315 RepID=UPI0006D57F37|nr:50S ribosomal protein L11 methyltransferase [Numidum massiliense]
MTKWAEICVHIGHEAQEAAANILYEAGAKGVVIEDSALPEREWEASYGEIYELNVEDYPSEGVILKAYLPLGSNLAETVENVTARVAGLVAYDLDIGPGTVTVNEVDPRDWESAWKKYYKPTRLAEKLIVKPTWEAYEPPHSGDIVIELDPGMAFGTGTHPSTALVLRSLEKIVQGGERVVDVGCGSGILSIAAAKLGTASVLALDVDDVAVEVTRENVRTNGAEAQVAVRQNDLLHGVEGPFDIALANILAEVILQFVGDAARVLKPGGYYIMSGIIEAKERLVTEALEAHQFRIVETIYQDDWVAITAQKR